MYVMVDLPTERVEDMLAAMRGVEQTDPERIHLVSEVKNAVPSVSAGKRMLQRLGFTPKARKGRVTGVDSRGLENAPTDWPSRTERP
jgi:hypothetical protein